jgi:hypothetical protein
LADEDYIGELDTEDWVTRREREPADRGPPSPGSSRVVVIRVDTVLPSRRVILVISDH